MEPIPNGTSFGKKHKQKWILVTPNHCVNLKFCTSTQNSYIPSFQQHLNIMRSTYELLTSDIVEIETVFLDLVYGIHRLPKNQNSPSIIIFRCCWVMVIELQFLKGIFKFLSFQLICGPCNYRALVFPIFVTSKLALEQKSPWSFEGILPEKKGLAFLAHRQSRLPISKEGNVMEMGKSMLCKCEVRRFEIF